jgi:hypothetical protein
MITWMAIKTVLPCALSQGRKRAAEGGAEAHKGKEPRARYVPHRPKTKCEPSDIDLIMPFCLHVATSPPRTAPAPAPNHTLPAASKGAHDLKEAEQASEAPRRLRKSTPR